MIFSVERWRFSYLLMKKRRNTSVERKTELESLFQMINNRSCRQVYMHFSISIESSWACAFNCPIVMTVSTSRVCWNCSSTASLEGKRFYEYESQIGISWITNVDFLVADTSALGSDVIDYFKYEKEWVFSGKVCWNSSSTASEEAWGSM